MPLFDAAKAMLLFYVTPLILNYLLGFYTIPARSIVAVGQLCLI